jgi:anti-anti-sigma factor
MDSRAGRALVVQVGGELDMVTTPWLQQILDERLGTSPPRRLVLDLTGVTFLGCPGLTLLIRLQQQSCAGGIQLALVGTGSPAVQLPLRLTGLLPQFDIHDSVPHALNDRPDPQQPTTPAQGTPAGFELARAVADAVL